MGYYLLSFMKLLIILGLAILAVRLIALFIECKKNFIDADIIRAISPKNNKVILKVALWTVLFVIAITGMKLVQSYLTGSINLMMVYPEASYGLNPNGSRYNVSDIISDEVLDKAVSYGHMGNIDTAVLKKALSIVPSDSSSGSDIRKAMVTTQVKLSYSPTRHTGLLKGQDVVNDVALAYSNWFIEKYGQNYSSLDMDFDDLSSYDYQDYKTYFEKKIGNIVRFSSAFNHKDAGFVSDETGKSFAEINSEAWSLNDTTLESLHSFILKNSLSKNSDDYSEKLRFDYIDNSRNYVKYLHSYNLRILANQRYDDDMATVLYIPTYDVDSRFYMSKTRIGIDGFSEEADDYSNRAAEVLDSMLSEQYRLQQLRENLSTDEKYEMVDVMSESLVSEINDMAKTLKTTAMEYIRESSNDYITFAKSSGWSLLDKKTIMCIVAFVMVVYLMYGLSAMKKMADEKVGGAE